MRSENFVAFFTASGFFIGIIFSILKFDSPMDVVFYTIAITLFFYLFVHFVLIYFIKTMNISAASFDKNEHEQIVNIQIDEIKTRENKITDMLKSIKENTLDEQKGVPVEH